MEIYDLQKAEADVNGIYVTLTQSLPEVIVVSAEQVITLREAVPVTPPAEEVSAKPSIPSEKGPITEEKVPEASKETEDTSALVVTNAEETVEWKFTNEQNTHNFTAEATVKAISETEVSEDFAYSGMLPEGTEVTVQLPLDNVNYQEGDTLYLYYCNPETD